MILKKHSCVIKDYPTEIKVSESKRAQYWKATETMPAKHVPAAIKDGYFIDAKGERFLKNTKTAGKPRMLSINAQKIYTGLHHSVRSKIVHELHNLFYTEFKKQLPAKIDLGTNQALISLHFYDVYSGKLPDLDNLAQLYLKCGVDCMTEQHNPNQSGAHKLGILPDDKMKYITHILIEFTPVTDVKERKLVFDLYEVSPNFTVQQLLDQQLCVKTPTAIQP